MSIQQAILFGGWNIPTKTISILITKKETTFASCMEGCGTCIWGIAKQVAVIGKSCGNVGQGMYSGHGYFMHYPAQHDGTAVTRR